MFILPEKITVNIVDKSGSPLCKSNILVGIKTFATTKNDIELSPFSSDDKGKIIITKQELLKLETEAINSALMDYALLNTAKPEVNIFLIDTEEVNKRINYLLELSKKQEANAHYLKTSIGNEQVGSLINDIKIVNDKISKELTIDLNSYNRKNKVDSISIKANWQEHEKEYSYDLVI